MQVVCDNRRKIRDIFIGYPGSVHDSRVFRTSPLSTQLAQNCGRNQYILGEWGPMHSDRGKLTRSQSNFNRCLATNRYVIEHCFGIRKQKFRQLNHIKLKGIEHICHFIRACCVLHNVALDDEFILAEELEANDLNENNEILEIQSDGHYDDRGGMASEFPKILKSIAATQYDIKEIKKTLQEIQISIKSLNVNENKNLHKIKFPLDTEEELNKFEEDLKNDDFCSEAVKIVSFIGGNNLKMFTAS
ncbi:hypothetical protein NQ317_016855 [Molorchus minor]|uniref:DDE Tnp4 domain-containing protein n=1 Tax=Molorchus minor TaxID=1323400 RepID=A0ABQ9JKE6_9CUCU|nr:hypothetical protein NQ317_016855 [Molorchus minor]